MRRAATIRRRRWKVAPRIWHIPCSKGERSLRSIPGRHPSRRARRRTTMKSTQLAVLLLVSLLSMADCKSHEADNSADTATSVQNSATAPADQTSQSTSGAVTQTTEHEIAGTSNANDLNPVKAQTMIDDVTIGHKVVDGTIPQADQGDDFAPGQPIYITMKVADTPATS